jgi:site-specific DNA recombinase
MRAVAYCRYSTDMQTENSIAYQLQNINKLCEAKGFVLVDVYSDEAKSGSNTQRDGLQRLLAEINTEKFDCVIIDDQSRLSRNVVDWFTLRELLQRAGKPLFSCAEKIEDYDENPSAFLTEGIRAMFNQQFLFDTRRKVIAGQTVKAKQGKFCGGLPPLGYNIEDGNYIVNPIEADAVRNIFEIYASGGSYRAIVDWLADQKIKSKRGKPIGENAVFEILRNERYIGRYTWNKRKVKYFGKWAGGVENPNMVVIEDAIPAIISKELWERVQRRMSDNTKNKVNKSRKNREYILSGLLRCAKCGGAFVGSTTTNKKGYEYKFYTCANKKRLHTCDARNIAANDIEPLILNILKREILDEGMIEKVADLILSSASNTKDDQQEALKKELVSVKGKIANFLKAIESGIFTESVSAHLADLEKQQKILEMKLAAIVPAVHVTRDQLIKQLREDAKALWESQDPAIIKEILKEYIVSVDIDDDEITIHAVSDPAENVKSRQFETDDLNTSGCGGRI